MIKINGTSRQNPPGDAPVPVSVPHDDTALLDLGRLLRTLGRRWWLVLGLPAVLATAAYAYAARQPETFGSASTLLFDRAVFDVDAASAGRLLETEAEVMRSAPLHQAVEEAIGYEADYSIRTYFLADVVEIQAEAPSVERAVTTANAVAEAYLDRRAERAATGLAAVTEDLNAQIEQLDAQIADLDRLSQAPAPFGLSADALLQQRLPLIEARASLRSTIQQRTVEANQMAAGVRVLAAAEPNSSPLEPRPVRTAGFALAVGLLGGIGAALLLGRSSRAVRNVDELRRDLPGVPVIGELNRRRPLGRLLRSAPDLPTTPDYAALRHALTDVQTGRPPRRIQITSPASGAQTTVIAANLAAAFADAGLAALVVDGNLQNPQLADLLALNGRPGLSEVLRGEVPLTEVVLSGPGRKLGALLAGKTEMPSSHLLTGERLARSFTQLADSCDVLIVDTPPIAESADASVISLFVDLTLVVSMPGRSTLGELREALDVLGRVHAQVGGVVLVDPPAELPLLRAPAVPVANNGAPRGDANVSDVDRISVPSGRGPAGRG